jgi:hypothetical protein
MKLQHRIILRTAKTIQAVNLAQHYKLKEDNRETTPFKLVFFTGASGLNYLNSSLISVHKFWKQLPDICIVSDGTSIDVLKKGLIKWSKKVHIFSWEECALSFKEKGNTYLYDYATNVLIGKKLIGLLYCAEKFPILYSDTDVLWLNSPSGLDFDSSHKPQIKMSKDIGFFYTKELLDNLKEQSCFDTTPFNSGVMYLSGNFSVYPKWKALSEYLGTHDNMGWFSEQTTFAILNNFFNPDNFFTTDEVLIKVDDVYSLKYTRKKYPNVLARHYVNVKGTTFWRDFTYIFFKK